jgi:arsenate reductase
MNMNNAKPTLLFVCVHNAGRSQLAAGLAALRGGDQVNVLSAGLDPDDKVSDVALASLAEAGIDRFDQLVGGTTEVHGSARTCAGTYVS